MSSSPWQKRARRSRKSKAQAGRPAKLRRPLLLLLEELEPRRAPAVLTVNSLADNTSDTSHLTLRDAIVLIDNGGNSNALGQPSMPAGWASQINTMMGGFGTSDTIVFAPALAGNVITLESAGDTSFGPSAFLISVPMTIQGDPANGIFIQRDASASPFRIFNINSSGNLTLRNLTVSNG
ncbi:MAG: hypothetical protein JO112_14335, partial [Planctomycetes bacterium]|nr:hypothetical protein [Planctomycetota bacterium]